MSDVESSNETPSRTLRMRARGWSRFLIIALALHIPLFIYPVLRLAEWLQSPLWLTLAILIPVAGSQTFSRIYLRHGGSSWIRLARQTTDLLLGVSPIILIALLLAELVVVGGLVTPANAAVSVLVVGASSAFLGLVTAITPMVKTISMKSAKLDQPVRFVQITDVHIGSRSKRFLEKIVYRINQLDPDFVCITGDFIDATGVPESDLRSLKSIRGPIYFSIGNHEKYEDLEDILARLRNLGVNVLRNEATQYADNLQVIGIDDMDDALQVGRQLPNIEVRTEDYVVLLYHRPRGLEAAAEHGIDLMLSGHTHNGQIVPFNLVVGRVFEMTKGLYRKDDTQLYVSQGTGTWGPVMRFGTRSEITLFEISPHTGE